MNKAVECTNTHPITIGRMGEDRMEKVKVLILGFGAQAKYVIDIAGYYENVEIIGMADVENNPEIHGKAIGHVQVLGNINDILPRLPASTRLVLAHRSNSVKEQVARKVEHGGFRFQSFVHPRAYVSDNATLGVGLIINANAAIMPFSRLGNHVVVHSNVVVEHDNLIEDFANLAPGVTLAGYVHVKKGAYVHTGASVIPGMTVGEHAVVGAGATVIENVPEGATVVGVPAKVANAPR